MDDIAAIRNAMDRLDEGAATADASAAGPWGGSSAPAGEKPVRDVMGLSPAEAMDRIGVGKAGDGAEPASLERRDRERIRKNLERDSTGAEARAARREAERGSLKSVANKFIIYEAKRRFEKGEGWSVTPLGADSGSGDLRIKFRLHVPIGRKIELDGNPPIPAAPVKWERVKTVLRHWAKVQVRWGSNDVLSWRVGAGNPQPPLLELQKSGIDDDGGYTVDVSMVIPPTYEPPRNHPLADGAPVGPMRESRRGSLNRGMQAAAGGGRADMGIVNESTYRKRTGISEARSHAPSQSGVTDAASRGVREAPKMEISSFVDNEYVMGTDEGDWMENLCETIMEESRRQFGDHHKQISLDESLSEGGGFGNLDLTIGFTVAWKILTDQMQRVLDNDPNHGGVADDNDLDFCGITFAWNDADMATAVKRYENSSGLSSRWQIKLGDFVNSFEKAGVDDYGEEVIGASVTTLLRRIFDILHEVVAYEDEDEERDPKYREDVEESANPFTHMDRAEMQNALGLQYSMLQETRGKADPGRAKLVENEGSLACHGGQWPDQNPYPRTSPEHRIWLDSFSETAALRHPSLSRRKMRETAFADGALVRGQKNPSIPYRDADLAEAFAAGHAEARRKALDPTTINWR